MKTMTTTRGEGRRDRAWSVHDDDKGISYLSDELMTLMERLGMDTAWLPTDRLHVYRIKASCETGYTQLSQFLGGLQTIPRAVTMHQLKVEPLDKGINVEMELDFYVRQPELTP